MKSNTPKLFGRIGRLSDVQKATQSVTAAGGKVTEETDELVTTELQGEICFRAICTSGEAWIVMYNENFWPK